MTFDEVMAALEAAGTEQNRKVYARHGVKGAMFGVSYATLGKLKKRIKRDHALAAALWASGNHDAQVLATMVADPAQTSAAMLEAWGADLDGYVIKDALSALAAESPDAQEVMARWTASEREWIGAAGWTVLAHLAMKDEAVDDAVLESHVAQIEARIHAAPNRTRHSMNRTLIAIGSRNEGLESRALAAAARIGVVRVDHGETGCKTPDAAAAIQKTLERRRGKQR